MIVRYIADLHFFDPSIVYWVESPETRVEQIVQNWNNVVRYDDLTFVLGDIGYYCPLLFKTIRRLNGMKVLIRGNHDDIDLWTKEECKSFDAIYDYLLSNGVLLIHRPQDRLLFSSNIDTTSNSLTSFITPKESDIDKVRWVIHGHLHTPQAEKVAGDYEQYIRETNRYNCAADMIGLCPRSILELASYKELVINTKEN